MGVLQEVAFFFFEETAFMTSFFVFLGEEALARVGLLLMERFCCCRSKIPTFISLLSLKRWSPL